MRLKLSIAAILTACVAAWATVPTIPAQDQDAVYRALAEAHWKQAVAITTALDAKKSRMAELEGAQALSDDQRATILAIVGPLLDNAITEAVNADISLESVYETWQAEHAGEGEGEGE